MARLRLTLSEAAALGDLDGISANPRKTAGDFSDSRTFVVYDRRFRVMSEHRLKMGDELKGAPATAVKEFERIFGSKGKGVGRGVNLL